MLRQVALGDDVLGARDRRHRVAAAGETRLLTVHSVDAHVPGGPPERGVRVLGLGVHAHGRHRDVDRRDRLAVLGRDTGRCRRRSSASSGSAGSSDPSGTVASWPAKNSASMP